MAFKLIKDVFDKYTNITVDKTLTTKLTFHVYSFVNKNETHSAHFGGNLVGVRPVRYIDADARSWLEDIMGIEEIRECQQELLKTPEVNPKFRISSDIVNLSFIYLMHRIGNSSLPKDSKDYALQEVIVMNLSKHMCSLLSHRFKFPSDEIIAQQLFESLDNRSHLKRYGSWLEMLKQTALEMLDPQKGIHTRRGVWQKMDNDKSVIYMTNDIQDRLAGQINLLTEKYHEIKNNSDRVLLNSSINTIDGEKVLAEYVKRERQLVTDMLEIVKDPRDFIRDELVEATLAIVSTAEETHFRRTLNFVTDNATSDARIPEAVSKVCLFVLQEARQGRLNLSQPSEIIGRLSNTFRSSRVKKKDALELKEIYREIAEEAIPNARDPIKVASAISTLIYMGIRMLTITRYR